MGISLWASDFLKLETAMTMMEVEQLMTAVSGLVLRMICLVSKCPLRFRTRLELSLSRQAGKPSDWTIDCSCARPFFQVL
jgi:hypothetical protein